MIKGGHHKKKLRSFKFNLILIAGAILFSAAILVFILLNQHNVTGPIPSSVRKKLDFTLYYPNRLPSGYSVDKNSISTQGDVLIFNISSHYGKKIGVSEEHVPTDVTLHQTSNAPITIPGEKNFDAPAGRAHIGLWGDKYVADIIGDDTWIIINVTGYNTNQATTIAQSFTKL